MTVQLRFLHSKKVQLLAMKRRRPGVNKITHYITIIHEVHNNLVCKHLNVIFYTILSYESLVMCQVHFICISFYSI